MRARSGAKGAILCALAIVCVVTFAGCGAPSLRHVPEQPQRAIEKKELPRLGYTIQAGAFASAENAAAFTSRLKDSGLDSTYFVAREGLYKVRFGNFATKKGARDRAEQLRQKGVIEEFYIVSPEQYAVFQRDKRGDGYFREELARTARSFLGVRYLWGGESVETGFDCSGLTMTVYQLNGIVLPRNSRQQFAAGNSVEISSLQKGDLIFFAGVGSKVSHVGIYIGNDQFIHAPGRGKKIRIDTLEGDYFRRTLVGAKSYL
ncbi:MAG: NlpC/P60 family protein [Syntrophales bacterium]|nr:NlpC/P60 family protein [Syntrophales bacterium]